MPDTVSVELFIPANAEEVWRALTTDRMTWWPELVFEAAVGSELVESWEEDDGVQQATGAVTAVDAPHALAFEWAEPGWQRPLRVRFGLMGTDGGTLVTVVESGFDTLHGRADLASEHAQGWAYHLDRLRAACERGTA